MLRIENLADHNMLAMSVNTGLPSDDRVVVLHDYFDGIQISAAVKYNEEHRAFVGSVTGEIIYVDSLTKYAIWSEALLGPYSGRSM